VTCGYIKDWGKDCSRSMDALAKTIGTSEFQYSMTVYSTFQRRLFDVRRIRWCVTIIATFDTYCKRDMWFYCHVFLSPL